MKASIAYIMCLFLSCLANGQSSEEIYFHNGDHIKPNLSDPHLELHSEENLGLITTLHYPVHSIIEIVNKNYDSLFIIDKYGHHIYDLNPERSARTRLLEIQVSTWEDGAYEVIAIKNDEAYHQKIVKL